MDKLHVLIRVMDSTQTRINNIAVLNDKSELKCGYELVLNKCYAFVSGWDLSVSRISD